MHDAAGSSTYCHHCGDVLIERDWYELGRFGLDANGACLACATPRQPPPAPIGHELVKVGPDDTLVDLARAHDLGFGEMMASVLRAASKRYARSSAE